MCFIIGEMSQDQESLTTFRLTGKALNQESLGLGSVFLKKNSAIMT